jgi:hypothetical protein
VAIGGNEYLKPGLAVSGNTYLRVAVSGQAGPQTATLNAADVKILWWSHGGVWWQ